MKIDLGKWGVPLAAVFTAAAAIVTDSVIDTDDIVKLLVSLTGFGATIAAGIKAWRSDPNKDKTSQN